jgi:hypothetical protein
MASLSITTLVVFLRHLQRLVLVDNLGGAFKWHVLSQVCGGRGGLAHDHYWGWWKLYFENPRIWQPHL